MNLQETVLVVDDEPSARDVIQGFLAQEPYNLIMAANATETFSVLEAVAPDVILLDIMLPDVDGFQVCRRIKADARWKNIPIILVTALNGETNMEAGYTAGADDFLQKPINDYELRLRVRSMLRIKHQYDSLQNALRLREDLSNMLVHDMRNPLTSIIGYGTLLKMKNSLVAEDERRVDVMVHQAQRLESFLNDMLIVAKQEQTGKMMVEWRPVRLQSLVDTIRNAHNLTTEARNVKLNVEAPVTDAEILADSNLLQRVIDNLISNATKFSPNGGVVTVQLETFTPPDADRPHLRLRVIDDGPGIPAEAKERIFKKYEVIALKQRNIQQVGLGLAFCSLVVEAHGGRIWVEDNTPCGSVFTVEL